MKKQRSRPVKLKASGFHLSADPDDDRFVVLVHDGRQEWHFGLGPEDAAAVLRALGDHFPAPEDP